MPGGGGVLWGRRLSDLISVVGGFEPSFSLVWAEFWAKIAAARDLLERFAWWPAVAPVAYVRYGCVLLRRRCSVVDVRHYWLS